MQGSNPCLVLMRNKDPWYRQCRFETRTDSGGLKIDTAWIPEKFAKVGKKIYLGEKRPDPTPIWTVTHVFSRRRESYVVARRMDYKHQRKVSDI